MLLTDPTFSNPLRLAIEWANSLSTFLLNLTRNEFVKTLPLPDEVTISAQVYKSPKRHNHFTGISHFHKNM